MDEYSLKAAAYLERKIREAEAISDPKYAMLKQKAKDAFIVLEQASGEDVRPALAVWLSAAIAHLATLHR